MSRWQRQSTGLAQGQRQPARDVSRDAKSVEPGGRLSRHAAPDAAGTARSLGAFCMFGRPSMASRRQSPKWARALLRTQCSEVETSPASHDASASSSSTSTRRSSTSACSTPLFERVFDDAHVMRRWFAEVVLYSEALTLSRRYHDFVEEIGVAALQMLGAIACRAAERGRRGRARRQDATPAAPCRRRAGACDALRRRLSTGDAHELSTVRRNEPARQRRARRPLRATVLGRLRRALQACAGDAERPRRAGARSRAGEPPARRRPPVGHARRDRPQASRPRW